MPVVPVRIAGTTVDIAVPSGPGVTGISMAGFRGRADGLIDLRMVPYPALTVFIDFGDALLTDDAGGERRRGSVVVGMAPDSVFRGCGRDIDLLQLRLSPPVAHAALGACSELGGTVVALEDLWGRDAGRIRERLHAAGSWDERFTIAQAAIARRGASGRAVDPEVAFAWRRMAMSRGRIRVEHLAAEVGWSRKRLWSRFGSQIGLTPKRAATLIRFDHAAHRLAAGHSAALVATDCGFVDQSHLNRDVMAFAGMTPTAVACAPWLDVDDVAWPATNPGL
ncbi:helix-turn-helix domain-containing protein [Nocardia sp. BMG51109]|uniref:AraC family transcriptional regulator n=1 Tax=Nocardia sp. BMG51109 TaxID=1056816 RepID=UPI000466B0C6|nr:helix-turn-helix domain-containing protein [Nocardia sp. BMG51109]